MRVLITRPEREAVTLATALSQRGHVPVIAPLFRLEILHPPADFAADYFLRQKAVPKLRLVVFPDDALLLDGLLEVFQARQVVLLADIIQPLDQVGLNGNVHILGALNQELLINHVPQ